MSFTKEHFVMVAEVLRESKSSKELIDKFVEAFDAKNPRFNKEIFRAVATHPNLID